jgi:hypothetical protein
VTAIIGQRRPSIRDRSPGCRVDAGDRRGMNALPVGITAFAVNQPSLENPRL